MKIQKTEYSTLLIAEISNLRIGKVKNKTEDNRLIAEDYDSFNDIVKEIEGKIETLKKAPIGE